MIFKYALCLPHAAVADPCRNNIGRYSCTGGLSCDHIHLLLHAGVVDLRYNESSDAASTALSMSSLVRPPPPPPPPTHRSSNITRGCRSQRSAYPIPAGAAPS